MMKIVTLRFEDRLEGFDHFYLSNFLTDKEITAWKGEFFQRNNRQYWTILMEYHLKNEKYKKNEKIGKNGTSKKKGRKRKRKSQGYKALLSERDQPLFNSLRQWRKERAKDEGIPAFIVFTNRQLAKIATLRPLSLNALESIRGIGKGKRKKYGKDLLTLIERSGSEPSAEKGASKDGGA